MAKDILTGIIVEWKDRFSEETMGPPTSGVLKKYLDKTP